MKKYTDHFYFISAYRISKTYQDYSNNVIWVSRSSKTSNAAPAPCPTGSTVWKQVQSVKSWRKFFNFFCFFITYFKSWVNVDIKAVCWSQTRVALTLRSYLPQPPPIQYDNALAIVTAALVPTSNSISPNS
jgi:hypothetical protein